MTFKDILFLVIVIALIAGATAINMFKNRSNDPDMIVAVHIKGEIKNPGYYELEYGDRLIDAIEKAGGETAVADTNRVNLAQKLRDGQEIIIPAVGDESFGKVNINTADAFELYTLDGIGESLAEKIVYYRDVNGKFSNIEDIKKVEGITEIVYSKIKNDITTG